MKKMRIFSIIIAAAIMVNSVSVVFAKDKKAEWLDTDGIYQNYKGGNRDNNPTTRNKERMFDHAASWAVGAIDDITEVQGNWYSESNEGKARALLMWLNTHVQIDSKKMTKIHKIGDKHGTTYATLEDMNWRNMRKHIGKFDPYSVLCKATKNWAGNKVVKLTPLEFCILYQLLADSLGYEKGYALAAPFSADVIVGMEDVPGRPSVKFYDRKGDEKTYTPKEKKIDFRLDIRTSDGTYFTKNLVDVESLMYGQITDSEAFCSKNYENFKINYTLERFYEID